jgi:arsenical pump membrane protein
MLLIFYKKLREPIEGQAEETRIESKPLLLIGIFLLAACTVLLAISSYIRIEMWLIACVAAAALTVAVLIFAVVKKRAPKELSRAYRRAPWELIPFVLSMFVMVLSLDKYGVTSFLAEGLGERQAVLTYGTVSALFANMVNNIPMSVLFSSVLTWAAPAARGRAMYAVVIGSNVGAFITPLGALAGIMWLSILKDNGVDFGFARFVRYGAVIAVPVLFAALGGLIISSAWAL